MARRDTKNYAKHTPGAKDIRLSEGQHQEDIGL